jgi:hypothetical protein
MNLVNVENVELPLDVEAFSPISESEYPYCMIGFQLKNSYDQKRIKLTSLLPVKDVVHKLPTSKAHPMFLRGLPLNVRPHFLPLLKQLRELNTTLHDNVDLIRYKHILNNYKLTCNDCFAYLRKGVYPIDGECLDLIADTNYTISDLYNSFNTKDIPAFQSFCTFTIFILCNESLYKK